MWKFPSLTETLRLELTYFCTVNFWEYLLTLVLLEILKIFLIYVEIVADMYGQRMKRQFCCCWKRLEFFFYIWYKYSKKKENRRNVTLCFKMVITKYLVVTCILKAWYFKKKIYVSPIIIKRHHICISFLCLSLTHK